MSAQQNQLEDLTEEEFISFTSSYSYTPVSSLHYYYTYWLQYWCYSLKSHSSNSVDCISQSALQFLEAYSHEDVTVAELQGSSNSLWTISPPSRQYLSQVLNLDHFPLTVSWTVQRSALVVIAVLTAVVALTVVAVLTVAAVVKNLKPFFLTGTWVWGQRWSLHQVNMWLTWTMRLVWSWSSYWMEPGHFLCEYRGRGSKGYCDLVVVISQHARGTNRNWLALAAD